jgi:transcriptional regulator with XRE-family HTH domain
MAQAVGMTVARTAEEAFGDVLSELRREHGLSQEALAFACGRHRTHVSLLERGQRSPTLGTLVELSRALDVSLVEMMRRLEGRLAERKPRRKRTI